jgi:hypothetical protein
MRGKKSEELVGLDISPVDLCIFGLSVYIISIHFFDWDGRNVGCALQYLLWVSIFQVE